MFIHALIFAKIFLFVNGEGEWEYDRYSGLKVDQALEKQLRLKAAHENCSITIQPCTTHEGRREDGTCNNLHHPTWGAARGPYLRMLKPDYPQNYGIRRDKHGNPLPSVRRVRTSLIHSGRVEGSKFTVAAFHMLELIQRDVTYLNEIKPLFTDRVDCCNRNTTNMTFNNPQDANVTAEDRCIPIEVPTDDPYLRASGTQCFNLTTVDTFQHVGCTLKTVPPEQINYQTPLIDLSTIYGVNDLDMKRVRAFDKGMLILERRNNTYVPKNVTEGQSICLQNEINEICYDFGFPEAGNWGLRTTSLHIFFIREHNRIAAILKQMNPCWNDDRLYKVARQINIATASNIYLYELLPLFFGFKNMEAYNLVSEHVRLLKSYNEKEPPMVFTEFDIAMRYFNTLIEGRIKLYDENYYSKHEFFQSETFLRQGLLEKDSNFKEINRGTFYQSASKLDDVYDPEVSEFHYRGLQAYHDLGSIAIQRGRELGLRGYNDYRHLCGLKHANNFEDLLDVMDIEKLQALKHLYVDVEDIDLIAGIFSENHIQGSFVGPTLFCIVAKQLRKFQQNDRFWYERGGQPHSFSLDQLHEIRKSNMARLACDNALGIKMIQPHAFLTPTYSNKMIACEHIAGPNLSIWKDHSCYKDSYPHIIYPAGYPMKHEDVRYFSPDFEQKNEEIRYPNVGYQQRTQDIKYPMSYMGTYSKIDGDEEFFESVNGKSQ